MAPKKEDRLAGRRILAPPSVWPDFPCPKGQKGWAGVVGKKKDAKTHFVTFPDSGDASKYFFSDEDITRWLVEEEEEAAPVTAPAKAPSGKADAGSGRGAAAAATAPASSHKGAGSGGAAGKRKEAAGGSQQQQEEEARPSKKGKGPAVAAENTELMSKDTLKNLILSTIEGLDKEQLRAAYRDILKLKHGRR